METPSSHLPGKPEGPRERKPSARSEGHIDPLIYPPKGAHTHTFIMLHGRGDSARNFAPYFVFAEQFNGRNIQESFPGMKFIFPTAKRRRVSHAHNRSMMNQWFDIASLGDTDLLNEIQIDGLRESSTMIHEIIHDESKLIPCENIILGGLSQGCATALYALLTFELPPTNDSSNIPSLRLGAVIGMSGWLPFRKAIDETVVPPRDDSPRYNPFRSDDENDDDRQVVCKEIEALNFLRDNIDLPPLITSQPAALNTPVFLGHGTADMTVDVKLGEDAVGTLKGLGINVTWHQYGDFGHWFKEPDEIDDIVDFLCEKMNLRSL